MSERKLQSPSQTVGPFFHYGLLFGGEHDLVQGETKGQRILITGRVVDGDGNNVPDAMLEIWQADANGVFAHPSDPYHEQADPHFAGFGRADTQQGGRYTFKTIKPGPPKGGGASAPHINVRLFSRGLLIHLVTRLYFSDENNALDPVFRALAKGRQETLVAQLENAHDLPTYHFDIRLQGKGETVFFDL